MDGYPQLAADHLLHTEMVGALSETVGNVIRQLNLEFARSEISPEEPQEIQKTKIRARQRAYELLVEVALNIIGTEANRVGFSSEETELTFGEIMNALKTWEKNEVSTMALLKTTVANAVSERFIEDAKKVAKGESLVSSMASEIESSLDRSSPASSLVMASRRSIEGNVYFRMAKLGLCKFGNDYAIGLRWLRHLGFVQVSTNPVLAARAYEDDSNLWGEFAKTIKLHPEWHDQPEQFADEIAMEATMTALWPNLAIFRPIALLSKLHDGLVSYQLNPGVADSVELSLKDAIRIYSSASRFLAEYDSYLLWGYSRVPERARPNIVFKIAAQSPAAAQITTALNEMGIGTNNTVTYTVGQEAELIIAAMKGMAKARKMGISITQTYETNMGGRLESHLREIEAERILRQTLKSSSNKEAILTTLAERLHALKEFEKFHGIDDRIRILCSFQFLKSLINPSFVEAVTPQGSDEKVRRQIVETLTEMENAIGHSGTLIARKVYWIFFSSENRIKWLNHLRSQYGLAKNQAEDILSKIDLLPASKRKPEDTLLTLGRKNVTNTEFPSQQLALSNASRQEGFNLMHYDNSMTHPANPSVLRSLSNVSDFRLAYGISPDLSKRLNAIGIECEPDVEGLLQNEWGAFGAVVKTMTEFNRAYSTFRDVAMAIVKETATSARGGKRD